MLSPLHRQEMSWSPPGGTTLSSAHTMRRRDGNVIQSDTWPSLHPQSGRWQGQSHESSSSSNSSGGGLYPERPRIRANQLYDDSQVVPRRDHESMVPNFPLRYPPHSAGSREGALQRLRWHSGDTPDSSRDPRRCNTQSTQNSFPSSPTLPFSPQGYHNTQPTYSSSWTPTDNLMTTPTLHSITQSPLSYDGYSSNSASIPSPDVEYTHVDGYRDS
jgi:Gti1/Pac2 family transcription factor